MPLPLLNFSGADLNSSGQDIASDLRQSMLGELDFREERLLCSLCGMSSSDFVAGAEEPGRLPRFPR